VGNIGKDTHRSYEDTRWISLSSVQTIQENQPPSVDWHFKDENGIYYPQSIKLLIIVMKKAEGHEAWFPFQLRLSWNLYVDTCRGSLFSRLVNRLGKHDGWKFDIKGRYQQKIAEEALEDVKHLNDGNAKTLGLKAAARIYLNERRQ